MYAIAAKHKSSESRLSPESEKAIRKLANKIEVSSKTNSNIIAINVRAESPGLAQEITDALTGVFLREHLRVNRTPGSYEFFEEQVDSVLAELTAATAAQRDKKNEYELVTVEGKRDILEQQLREINLAALRTERSR